MEKLYLENIGFTKPTIVRKDNMKVETVGLCVEDLVETWRRCFLIPSGTIYLICKERDMIAISKSVMSSAKSVKELLSENGVKCVVEEEE